MALDYSYCIHDAYGADNGTLGASGSEGGSPVPEGAAQALGRATYGE